TLDELPPGRTPITTVWARGPLEESDAWSRVRTEVEAGHQAYVVCPLIEEPDKIEARSAQEEFDRRRANELARLRLGLLHGRVPEVAVAIVAADAVRATDAVLDAVIGYLGDVEEADCPSKSRPGPNLVQLVGRARNTCTENGYASCGSGWLRSRKLPEGSLR